MANEMDTEGDYFRQKSLADRVLDRLVQSDNVLIELTNEAGEAILVVHPNFNPESNDWADYVVDYNFDLYDPLKHVLVLERYSRILTYYMKSSVSITSNFRIVQHCQPKLPFDGFTTTPAY